MRRRVLLGWIVSLAVGTAVPASARTNPFLGTWNLTAQGARGVYWLGVEEAGGRLSALFLNRGGSPVPVERLKAEGDTLSFALPGREGVPGPEVRLQARGGRLTGTHQHRGTTLALSGERPPRWGRHDANARHRFGAPVELFDGKSLDGWGVQLTDRPVMWRVEGGVLANEAHGNNLVSKRKFQDFKIDAEYKVEHRSNSGIYLRGRYELQVLDDAGTPPEMHGHMAVYGRKAPDRNASRKPGEWQTMSAVLVGNRVTVTLNGVRVHDNAVIDGVTGGALDAAELEPGPIMIQGDHQRIWFRKVTVTPILDARK